MILKTVEENPGLHFREIQRRTLCANGQLQYHLYQLERDGILVRKVDGKITRYFSNESGTVMERNLLFHLRNRDSLYLISKLLRGDIREADLMGKKGNRKFLDRMNLLVKDGIVKKTGTGDQATFSLTDVDYIKNVLKRFRESFLDTLALNLFSLLK